MSHLNRLFFGRIWLISLIVGSFCDFLSSFLSMDCIQDDHSILSFLATQISLNFRQYLTCLRFPAKLVTRMGRLWLRSAVRKTKNGNSFYLFIGLPRFQKKPKHSSLEMCTRKYVYTTPFLPKRPVVSGERERDGDCVLNTEINNFAIFQQAFCWLVYLMAAYYISLFAVCETDSEFVGSRGK